MKALGTLLLLVSLSACSTSQIIRDSEYKYSEAAFAFANPNKALQDFPTKEKNGFVTSIEKSWLGFWAGETDQSQLKKQSRTLDERKYISISREAEYFFMNESEEGYIPAEHEVVLMHMISSMYYMQAKQWDEARVEVKAASYFLENFFQSGQKHFDDPALRIWLAALWSALGEWNEAQVDLRRAYELTKDKNLLPLLKDTTPPKEISLAFDGSGPQVTWKFGNPLPSFSEKDPRPAFKISYSTLPWFQRHQERNTVIRDQISKSNYMSQYYGVQLNTGSQKTIGFISSTTLRASGLVLGTAIAVGGLYAIAVSGATSASGEVFALPIIAGYSVAQYFWKGGDSIDETIKGNVKETEDKAKEDLKTYRFVRFLPSWISLTEGVVVTATGKEIALKSPKSATTVRFVQRY